MTASVSSSLTCLPPAAALESMPAMDRSAALTEPGHSRLRWGAWATLGWLVAVLLAGAAMEMLTEAWLGRSAITTAIIQFAGKLTTVAVCFVAAYWSRQQVSEYLGLVRPYRGHAVAIAVVGVVALMTTPVVWLVIAPRLGLPWDWPATGAPMTPALLSWVVAGLVAPFVEEVLCRGLLYRGFAQSRLGVPGAIVLTAALFTALHAPEFADSSSWYLDVLRIAVIGLLFGWLRMRTGSVLPTWGIHTLHNAVQSPLMLHVLASS